MQVISDDIEINEKRSDIKTNVLSLSTLCSHGRGRPEVNNLGIRLIRVAHNLEFSADSVTIIYDGVVFDVSIKKEEILTTKY